MLRSVKIVGAAALCHYDIDSIDDRAAFDSYR